MTGAITAVAVGVAGAAAGAYEASQSASVAREGLGIAETTQSEQQYYNSMLQTLIANPGSVSSLPGFQFELDTGSKAVAAGFGPAGLAGSGNEAAALTSFGQGLAGQFYLQQTGLLASLSGVTNASSPAQGINAATSANANSTQNISNLLNTLGFYGAIGSKGGLFSGASSGTPASIPSSIGGPGYGGGTYGPGSGGSLA